MKFQSEEPLIHLLYLAMGEQLRDLLTKFVKKQLIFNDNDTNVKLKPISKLQPIDLSNKRIFRTLKQSDIDTKASCFL